MKTVLIIEDDDTVQNNLREALSAEDVSVIQIRSLEAAQKLIANKYDFDDLALIVMDACLGKDIRIPNTLEVTKQIRSQGYTGNILASSSSDDFNLELIQAGANLSIPKIQITGKVFECLGLEW